MARIYKVFISHSWSYVSDLKSLQTLLENRGYFNVQFEEATPDVPINSVNADYIKTRLREKIRNSNVVLGIAGIYASHSEWMVWELDTAIKNNIPIIGVVPRGAERISTVVKSRSKEEVKWNTESIVAAIRRWT
ncbi:TIR domain-containing protein [Tenacibaculum ascidiaceicola]|uniref:TIR domain-containing protein n=1 Tax=Tenacibaculum ascidiaceicola TaxID=1699411 RepID=UPI003CE4A580